MGLLYRQGDWWFVQQETPPAAPLTQLPEAVIVVGEATSHAHRLLLGTMREVPDGARSLDVHHATQVAHEAQGSITLDPGLWLVVRKPEYSPQVVRRVAS